uniref:ShKT domain-containing protein n=1 Tax=Panagrellus redivivus TaxID=6233 RepID=A0A7E4VWI0_PANRE
MAFTFGKSTTFVVLGLFGLIACAYGATTQTLPPTEDRYGTDYCSAVKASNAAEFKTKCETDSGFRFYFCGITCDSLYSTAETLQASKASALAYACDDMFTAYFCNNMKNTSKCAGNTTYTAFRLCTKTCGYC